MPDYVIPHIEGLTIAFSDGTTSASFERLTDFTPPGGEVEDLDLSNLTEFAAQTGNVKSRVFRPGTSDPGEMSFSQVPSPSDLIAKDAVLGLFGTWTVTIAGIATCNFDGYLKTAEADGPFGEATTIEYGVKVSGEVVWAATGV